MAESIGKGSQQGRIIGRVLPGAVKLWLQTQVEAVDSLVVDLIGRDRQLISGYIPGVTVSAKNVIYKGIALSEVQLGAEDIRINLGQVVRGKALRLMKQFPVEGQVLLSDADVAACVSSPLLAQGITDFWRSLIQKPEFTRSVNERYGNRSLQADTWLHRPQITLGEDCLALSFYPCSQNRDGQEQNSQQQDEQLIILGTRLAVSGQFLNLISPCWLDDVSMLTDIRQGELIEALSDFCWDLGKDTRLSQLEIQPTQLICAGQVMVNP